jgi:hypothetical protein
LGKFDIIGLGNQENGYTNGYQIWLTSADGIVQVPEPVSLCLIGLGSCLVAVRRRFKF